MRPLLQRLGDPLGLVVLGAGILTALRTGEIWLAPLAVAGWGLIVFGRKAEETPPEPAEVVPVLTGEQAEAERRLQRLVQKITKAVDEANPVVQAYVGDLPKQAAGLVEECRELLVKQCALDQFLAEAESDDPRRELEHSRKEEAAARDAVVRGRWAQARVAAEARLAEVEQIRTNRSRMAAELAEVEIRLKQVHSRIVSLDSRDEERLTGISGELRSNLGDLTQQIAVFDRMLPIDQPTDTGGSGTAPARQAQ